MSAVCALNLNVSVSVELFFPPQGVLAMYYSLCVCRLMIAGLAL